MSLQRYKLTLAYRGTNYYGWQFQYPNALYKGPAPLPGQGIPTVQQAVQRAIQTVVRHAVTVVGSSRTDTGVHAKGQLAHFDTPVSNIPSERFRLAINHQLPDDILIRTIEPVGHQFNAVASTTRKRYQYLIWAADDRAPFTADLAWHRWQPLDLVAMQEASKHFVGEQDFASFARARHGRESTIRTVYACDVSRRGRRVVIGVEGNGFLWHMIRIMVGTLVEVGLKKYEPRDVAMMLAARDRRAGGSTAPPHGLYLQWVKTR